MNNACFAEIVSVVHVPCCAVTVGTAGYLRRGAIIKRPQ
jgi:hypothetical protein